MAIKKCVVCRSRTKLFVASLYDDRYGAPGFYSVYKCIKCGFGRTEPVLKKEKIGDFYRKYYPLNLITPQDVKKYANVIPGLLLWLAGIDNTAHRHINPGAKVLDVGSGSGISLIEIKRMGADGYGVEPDPNAQKIAKKLKLNVYKGFITENPFPKTKFDFVTGSQVFEHESDIFKFLKSAKSKLKDGGKIILSVPNFDSIFLKIFGRKWLNWHVPYHINFFTKSTFEKLSEKSNLKIIKVQTITPNVWTLMQVRSLFGGVKEGQKNPIWTSAASGGYTDETSFDFKSFIFRLAAIVFYILITPINRLIDFWGLGDSLLVVLKNKE